MYGRRPLPRSPAGRLPGMPAPTETPGESPGTAVSAVTGEVSTLPERKPGTFYPGDPRIAKGLEAARIAIANGAGKGVAGRPRSVTREAARLAFEKRISFLEAVIDGDPLEFRKKVRYKKVELQDGEGPDDPGALEAGKVVINTFTVIETTQSASVDERLAAMEMLGKMGAVNQPGEEEDVDDPTRPRPVYVIAFD